MLYDSLLVGALLFVATVPFIAIRSGEPVDSSNNLFYRIVLAVVVYAFFVGFWSRSGRTLGMQSWGLQLETADGDIPSAAKASLRFFAALISLLPFGFGFVWQIWDPEKLTWHDRISKTRLVHYPRDKAQKKA
ncbi:MAG: RDD family protein [Gammaproteobacteria bacterium]|nr:RDD family protein [Gammaproteobacteria bacterium]